MVEEKHVFMTEEFKTLMRDLWISFRENKNYDTLRMYRPTTFVKAPDFVGDTLDLTFSDNELGRLFYEEFKSRNLPGVTFKMEGE